jgi:5-methyltetrahydropteroyltriglutamate--homocysteine methyltransferase
MVPPDHREENMTASTGAKPFFRAEQVGSLLRPQRLLDARDRWKAGEITRDELHAVEDDAIAEAVAMQEEIGLEVIVDGEFRRENWWIDYIEQIDGIEIAGDDDASGFKDAPDHKSGYVPKNVLTVGKIGHSHPILVDDYKMLRATTDRTPKITIPSPSRIHYHGGRPAVSKDAYPDMDAFWADVARAYQDEIADLEAQGCNYIQIDDPVIAYFVDESLHDNVRKLGEEPDELVRTYVRVINDCIAKRKPETYLGFHLCRGNAKSSWMGSGGYDSIAEPIFAHLDVDAFFLEYDDERSGDFEALRHVPKGKKVVLGLITTKFAPLENKDELKRRIDDASRFVPMEDLALSPQCGFASVVEGNKVTVDDERAKLGLVVEVAHEVWGDA